jgi:hypothetical protein
LTFNIFRDYLNSNFKDVNEVAMTGFKPAILAVLLLSACGGNPFVAPSDDGGDPPATPLVPATVTKHVAAAGLDTWAADDATLRIRMTAQDATDLDALYERDASLDVGSYQAYVYQSTTSNRKVVALVNGTSNIKAVAAMEAGQFADDHMGSQAWRADVFTAPSAGVGASFDYSGTYAGLLNRGSALDGPGGTLDPEQAYRTTGRVLITADFTEMSVSGGIDQREVIETSEVLPSIALKKTGIAANGTFAGIVVESDGLGHDSRTIGDYGGAFAGLNASEIAVLLLFNPQEGGDGFEQGIITLPSCTTGGGPACP